MAANSASVILRVNGSPVVSSIKTENALAQWFRTSGPLFLDQADNVFGKDRVSGWSSASARSVCIGDVPSAGDQAEETIIKAKNGFNGKVSQIMKIEVSTPPVVFLPREKAVLTHAS